MRPPARSSAPPAAARPRRRTPLSCPERVADEQMKRCRGAHGRAPLRCSWIRGHVARGIPRGELQRVNELAAHLLDVLAMLGDTVPVIGKRLLNRFSCRIGVL